MRALHWSSSALRLRSLRKHRVPNVAPSLRYLLKRVIGVLSRVVCICSGRFIEQVSPGSELTEKATFENLYPQFFVRHAPKSGALIGPRQDPGVPNLRCLRNPSLQANGYNYAEALCF